MLNRIEGTCNRTDSVAGGVPHTVVDGNRGGGHRAAILLRRPLGLSPRWPGAGSRSTRVPDSRSAPSLVDVGSDVVEQILELVFVVPGPLVPLRTTRLRQADLQQVVASVQGTRIAVGADGIGIG